MAPEIPQVTLNDPQSMVDGVTQILATDDAALKAWIQSCPGNPWFPSLMDEVKYTLTLLREYHDRNATNEQRIKRILELKQLVAYMNDKLNFEQYSDPKQYMLRSFVQVFELAQEVFNDSLNPGPTIHIKLLSPTAQMPTKAHNNDAGWDLYLPADVTLAPTSQTMVPLGIAVNIPDGWFLELVLRSSIGKNTFVRQSNSVGIIDSGYKGEICQLLYNSSPSSVYKFKSGERIAQLILHKTRDCVLEQVDEFPEEENSRANENGEQGFGSTGA